MDENSNEIVNRKNHQQAYNAIRNAYVKDREAIARIIASHMSDEMKIKHIQRMISARIFFIESCDIHKEF